MIVVIQSCQWQEVPMKQYNARYVLVLVCIVICFFAVSTRLDAGAASVDQVLAAPAFDLDSSCNTGRSVQVSGTAVLNVVPDRVRVELGVQSNAATPQLVEAENSKAIASVLESLDRLGIEKKDIVTDWYVIEPIYESYDSLYIKGYRIHNLIAITLRDLSKVNRVITAALDAGANQIVNVEFYLSDLRQYRDQARELAVQAADEKAAALASAAGTQTTCVLSINENSWSYYNGGWYAQNRDLWTQNTIQNAAPSGIGQDVLSDAGPVSLGMISIRAEVGASFGLK